MRIFILGLTFTAAGRAEPADTPQLDVLLVTNEVPEAQSNDQAAYLAQRTQRGNGNSDTSAAASPSSQGVPDVMRDERGQGVGDEQGAQHARRTIRSTQFRCVLFTSIRWSGLNLPPAASTALTAIHWR